MKRGYQLQNLQKSIVMLNLFVNYKLQVHQDPCQFYGRHVYSGSQHDQRGFPPRPAPWGLTWDAPNTSSIPMHRKGDIENDPKKIIRNYTTDKKRKKEKKRKETKENPNIQTKIQSNPPRVPERSLYQL